MNLTTDPWIPVVWDTGKPGDVALKEAFSRGHEIRDLSVRPHERIALMRLLICIAQAALDGPADYDDWKTCRPRIALCALDYLERWQSAFELFGNGPRFMQIKGNGKLGTMELDKLDFVDADMTTLFDQDVVMGRHRNPSWAALRLITYQSFAAGGTVGGSAEIAGKLRPQKGKNGPCRDSSAFHAFIRRENLLFTVHANLVSKDTVARCHPLIWGCPIWEIGATALTELEDQTAITKSYFGRLAPLSRAVWLNEDLSTALNANGLSYPSFTDEGIRDSTTTVRVIRDAHGQDQRQLLSAIEGGNIRKPWRELHALTVKRINDQGVGGPLALGNLSDESSFDLWVGSLVTGRAKIEDTVESTYNVPAEMLYEATQKIYESGVQHANDWERQLRRAIEFYRLAMQTNKEDERMQQSMDKLKKSEKQRLAAISNKAYPAFWTLVEQKLNLLNRLATEVIPLKNGRPAWTETDWGIHVRSVTRTVYEAACPHGTARQIRAYALGRKALFAAPTQKHDDEETEL